MGAAIGIQPPNPDLRGNHMMNKGQTWMHNLTIRSNLILLIVVVTIIPIILIGAISLNVSSRTMLEKNVQNSIARLEFIDYRVNEILKNIHKNAVVLAYHDNVRSYSDPDVELAQEEQIFLEEKVKRQIMGFYNNQQLSSILLVQKDGQALSYSSDGYSSVQKINAADLLPADTSELPIFELWCDARWSGRDAVLPYKRIVLGKTDHEPAAFLVFNIKEEIFMNLYRSYESMYQAEYYIINRRGIIQSCTDKTLFSQHVNTALGFSMSKLRGDSGYFAIDRDKEEYVAVYTFNPQRNLYFLELTRMSSINEGFYPIVTFTLLIALLGVAISLFLGYLLSRSFMRPLYALLDRVESYDEKGDASMAISKNEFVILSSKYEQLILKLQNSIAEYYEEQKKKKEAEIRALEFQIKPHFLYNTLATIIWLIEKGEDRKAIKITKDLSAFFRISISKGRELIPIRDELKHIELYMGIQKTRYENKIDMVYEVPDSLLDYLTPKLILQPLVENSINHGIQARADKTGLIRILGRFENGDIVLEVRDNGESATAEVIEKMNRSLQRSDEKGEADHGIGISNVHNRISMLFGEGYGLHYFREGGETVASIRIKAITED